MNKSRVLLIAVSTAFSINAFSQTAPDSTKKKLSPLPSLMGGVGVLYFNGNIGKGSGITAYSTVRTGYTFGIEERPVPLFGIQLSGVMGKLSASERSDNPSDNKNFQSNITQGDLTFYLHLCNKPTDAISPFIYAGVSFMSYQRFTDSLSAAGTPYYYWTDGSIRSQPQNASDVITAKIIQRDYTYETPLGNGTSLSVPVGVGFKMRLTDNLAVNVQAAYYFSFSKSIEYYTANGGANEKYLFSFCTIEYHFTHKVTEAEDAHYRNTDFKNIDTKDEIKPTEISKDDEAALLAKEEKSAKDTFSVDHSEADFFKDPNSDEAQKLKRRIDSIAKSHPSGGGPGPTNAGGSNHVLPDRFKPADYDHNGYISSEEITKTIDDFFSGTSPMTITDINALIDYFFDQDSSK